MRRITTITVTILLALLSQYPAMSDRNVGSIEMAANPKSIPADGKSVCIISAQVRDKAGAAVDDHTQIHFSSSQGVIEETVETVAGVARAKLVSANIPGTAVITATWVEGPAVSRIDVEFGDVSATAKGPQYVIVSADDYLAYSADNKTFEAIGNVRIQYHSLDMEAREAQIDLKKNRIIAKGGDATHPVKIRAGDKAIEGNMFTYDLTSSSGLIVSAADGNIQQVDLSKSAPKIAPATMLSMQDTFDFADLSDSSIVIKAYEATIFPYDKIQFKGAGVYIDGKRIIYLPYYVLPLNGNMPDGQQYVGYSTSGVTLNLPLYYSLTPTFSGAMTVRHGESSGWGLYGQRPGWGVDMRQTYLTDKSQGAFAFDQISSDWGAHFTHSQQFDPRTHGYLYLDYPEHKSLFGNFNLNRTFNAFDMGLNLYGTKSLVGDSSMTGDVSLQTHPKPIWRLPLRYTLSTRSAYSTISGSSGTSTVSGSTDSGSSQSAQSFSQSIQSNAYSLPVNLARNLSFRYSMGLGCIIGDRNMSGLSSLASGVMDWKMSPYSSLQLSYRYADNASIYASSIGKQSLSANLIMSDGKKLRASVYAIKGLDYKSTNIFTDFSYQLHPRLQFGVRTTLNVYGTSSYKDLELSLGYKIEGRQLNAVWSKSQKKIMFELGSAGF